jgi:hypothetical protein
MHRWLIAIGVFFAILIAPAFLEDAKASETDRDYIKTQATERNLQDDIHWLALLHYRRNTLSGKYLSEADAPDFFLSSSGARDPLAELLATIDAIFLPVELGNEHPQCVFPARSVWLIKQLKIDESEIPHPDCSLLRQWRSDFAPTQATVVFPTSYMNNPSSMFGHAFLKFESSGNYQADGLMAYTINFAADTSSQHGAFDHLYRGLSGGFPSNNSIMRYYRMLKQYSDIENRDIWEFKLNLSQEEMDRLVLHVWELKDRHVFKYYFLKENCAYRLITLIEAARPELNISGLFSFYTIPADAVRSLRDSNAIKETAYKASAHKTFNHHVEKLDDNEKQLVIDIVTGNIPLENERLRILAPGRRPVVLAMASEYLGLLINKDTIDRKASAELEKKLFLERLKYDVPMIVEEMPPPAVSPDLGHRGRRIALGVGRDKDGDFLSFGYRESYHDLMDPLPGFEKGMKIEFLNAELRKYEQGDIRLEKIDLINLSSLTPIDGFFHPLSWKFSMGREKRELDYRRPVNFLEGGWGITYKAREIVTFGMLEVSLENSQAFASGYGLGAGANIELLYQSDQFSYHFEVDSKKYVDSKAGGILKYFGEFSMPVYRNLAVVASTMTSRNHWGRFYENTITARIYY